MESTKPGDIPKPNPDEVRKGYKEFVELQDKAFHLSKQVEERYSLLEAKEKRWKFLKGQMKKDAAKAKHKIRLEIGGKIFTTSKSSLLRVEGTYFHAMLSSGKWQPDEDGVYFVDRNPKYFDRILDYLRTGELSLEGLDTVAIHKLEKDLEYYMIEMPIQTKMVCK
jgi:hypothetical protein